MTTCDGTHGSPGSQCSEAAAAVYPYIDGELDARVAERILGHLEQCPPCLHQYAVEQRVKALVQRASACHGAPESLRVTIRAQITSIRITYRP